MIDNKRILKSRLYLLTEIIKLLLHIIPRNRNSKTKEPDFTYQAYQYVSLDDFEFPLISNYG